MIEQSRPIVTLIDGTEVSSWSQEWLVECRDRHFEVLKIMRLNDRESRRAYIAEYERIMATTAPLGVRDRAAYAAEARRRLEAAVIDHWQRARTTRAA